MLFAHQPASHTEANKNRRLWSKLRKGDQQALSKLFALHHRHLFNYGLKINSDPELVRECIQALFLNIWEHHARLGCADSPRAYLLASLRRKLLEEKNRIRARAVRAFKFIEIQNREVFTAEELMVHKEVNSENRLILQQALNQLTPRQKEVIYLRFYHGLTNPEISGVMDINDQCVRNLLSGAIKRLRQRAVEMMAPE